MARLRHALGAAVALLAALLLPRVTSAQSCHVPPPEELREPGWRLTLGQETARFKSSRYEGHYEDVVVSGSVAWRRLYAGAVLPAYRIVRNGLPGRGFGDLLVHSRARLLGAEGATTNGGLALGLSLPTGDARAELGMGHVMLSPGVWATAQVDSISFSSMVAYAKALSGNHVHHHSGVGPLVMPMSSSEIDAALLASVPIHPSVTNLRLRAGLDGALPLGDENGVARVDWRAGLQFVDRVTSSIELRLPVTGEVSTLKLVLELSVGFR
jgi:hypothetical protein